MNSQKKPFAFGGAMYAAGGSFNNPGFAKLPKDVQAKIKARSFASGGPMAQLTEFTEGGRHEENPIGGIPQGFAPDGQPNLVEQGETKLNSDDYIYSDTLKVTKDIALDFSLPKNYIGKTFAEVSKEANRPKSRRENDTIEVIAIKRDLDNLMQAQEEFKKRDLEKDMQMMMEKHPQEMQQMMAGAQGAPQGPPQEGMAPGQEMQGPPPEMAPEGQIPQSAQMGMPQGQPMDPSQMPPEMLAQMQGAQQGQPVMRMGGNIYMCGGKMYDFGGWMDENNGAVGGAGKGALTGAATGASIGSAVPVIGTAIGAAAGAIIGGVAGGIKGSKADKLENAADAEAARFATAQSQAMNANALMPDMNNVVNSPYQETISPMGMMGQSYAAGGWMDNNANAIGNTGTGMMSGASTGLETGKQFDVPGQTPWGSIIGAGVGAIGGGISGMASGRQEDEQAQREQQAMYAQGKTSRQQSNMMMNAPQMYQQYMLNSMQNPMMNQMNPMMGQMNQMNGAQMAKYGGRQYPDGGPISNYQMTPAMFAKEFPSYNYKTELQGYNNNPKNSAGVPIQGGDYVSLTPQQRADALKYYESLPQNQIGAQEWSSYQHLNSTAPYFVDKSFNTAYDPATSWSSGQMHYLNQPVDLTKHLYNAPATPAGTPPAPASTGLPQINIDNGPMVDVKPEQFAFKPAVEHMYDAAGNKTGTQTISAADVQKRFAAGEKNAAMSPYWSSDRNSDGEQVPGNTGTSYFNQLPSMFRTQTDAGGNKMLTGYGGTGPGAKGANAPVTLQTPVAIPGSFAYGGNLRSHSFAPGGALTGPITGYKMTPAQFAAYYPNYNYATEVKGWTDNPKGKLGQPLHGDDYLPMTAAQRADGIAYYESLPASQIDPYVWASYQELISGTPYFPNTYWHDNYDPAVSWEHRNMHYLNKPIDLTKLLYNPPAAPTATTSTPSTVSTTSKPAGGTPPATTPAPPTAPAPQGPFYMLNPHTGQPVMDYDPVTKQNVPRVAPEGSISHVPYSQGAAMVADNPAARAKEEKQMADRAMSDLIMQNPDEKALWQAHKKENPNAVFIDYRNQRVPTLQQSTTTPAAAETTTPGSFAYGGNLRSHSYAMGGMLPEDEGIARLDRQLANLNRMQGGFLNSPGLHSYAYGDRLNFEGDPVKGETRVNDQGITEIYNGTEWEVDPNSLITPELNAQYEQDNQNFIDEELAGRFNSGEFQRDLQKADEALKDKNLNLEINQSLPEFLASAAPAAYNLGQGIFGKVQQLNPQDYMIGANMQPYQYNINPQLREADQSFAQGQEAVRNAGLGGGNYATNMQQLANSRNQAIGGLYAQKQNADAESYNQAMSQNKAIEAQNLERKMGIFDFNLKSKAAKTAMLQSGLTQLAQVSEGSQSKKLQLALMKALAPDFAGTMAYNSIADQYLNNMKEKKKAKATDKTKG
jgi:hypothetical protein